MKNLFSSFLLSVLLVVSSCQTTLMSHKKQNSLDSVVKVGKTYTFIKNDGTKTRLNVKSIDEKTIVGEDAWSEKKEINRDEIVEVKKSNTVGTAAIIVGAIAIAIIGPAYYKNEPIGGK